MRIDRTHRGWSIATAMLLIGGLIGYAVYATTQPGGPRGGTAIGLAFGIAGYALMLFAGLLGARKKVPVWRIGRATTWMRGHLWLGFLTLPLILFHAGFAMRGPLTFILMMLFFIVWISGLVGAVIQHYLPQQLTLRIPLETIYEEIPHVRQQLAAEADSLIREIEIEAEQEDKARLRTAYQSQIRPFLVAAQPAGFALADGRRASMLFEGYRRAFPAQLHPPLASLETICEEGRQLIRQRTYYHWLHIWQIVHVPLSIALLVLGGIHAVMALRY